MCSVGDHPDMTSTVGEEGDKLNEFDMKFCGRRIQHVPKIESNRAGL